MATREDIEKIVGLLEDSHPADFYKRMDKTTAGIGAVLRYLQQSQNPVTAGQISSFMNVSTARVAVLLKKMEAKGLILKETGEADARTTVVRLSACGREKVESICEYMHSQVGVLIDKIGLNRLIEFADISKEIRSVMKDPSFEITDEE